MTIQALIERLALAGAGALVVGAGSMIVSNNTKAQVHEQRIGRLESAMDKVPDIDKNVLILSGKVDVLSQKLDDARDARLAPK